ncbi:MULTISPECIES: TIGR03619 family F420-dependent LLM class oxidoreductase [Actinomadura]|uniref:TIGR03619 family F420-dependent LLM class oxidoreductase n=1 Tax=Actinomadura yumaensis TaxID=111807 RepID=A0ABW2CN37_9ACTN|nr:TIGR03619 family F420-dependent LLM class oxidoreductase [Actinomadura sp. J1-007]MWK37965.1 TIGR03619 family F420-dependent LLM class oxidoreductase [Actinomadura sp. J1-007]
MEIGVNILNFGPHATPSGLESWTAFAETSGLGFAMISDHVAVTPDVAAQYPAPFYDPFTTLAWLAGRTSRIMLGTTVAVLPYRHPLHTARVTANLAELSGGRLILGVGTGWSPLEYAALDVPFDGRGRATDDHLRTIIDAWTHDEIIHNGQTVSTAPRPTPPPPVWVGGDSAPAVRRAARFGDAWHPLFASPAWLRESGLPALREAAAAAGRPVPALAPRIRIHRTETSLASRDPGQGDTAQIRDDIEGYRSLGATHLLLDTYLGDPATIRTPEEDQAVLAELLDL